MFTNYVDKTRYRAAGTYKDMRTGPHHVFRIEGEKIRSKLTLIPSLNSELENFALMSVLRMKISLKKI